MNHLQDGLNQQIQDLHTSIVVQDQLLQQLQTKFDTANKQIQVLMETGSKRTNMPLDLSQLIRSSYKALPEDSPKWDFTKLFNDAYNEEITKRVKEIMNDGSAELVQNNVDKIRSFQGSKKTCQIQ